MRTEHIYILYYLYIVTPKRKLTYLLSLQMKPQITLTNLPLLCEVLIKKFKIRTSKIVSQRYYKPTHLANNVAHNYSYS